MDVDDAEVSASSFPEMNPNDVYDRLIMRENLPSYEGKKALYDDFEKMTTEEKSEELHNAFAQ